MSAANPAETAPTPVASSSTDGFFAARDGLQLFWRLDLPDGEPKAHLIYLHGYSDHSGRTPELFEHLVGEGFAVHAFDCRGHGRSSGRRGHIDRFEDYLGDMEDFVARVRSEIPDDKKLFIVCHSHGGLITSRWLLDRTESRERIAGIVYSAPFYRLGFVPPPVKVFISKLIGKVIPFLPVGNELEEDKLTHDEAIQERTRKDPLYLHKTTPRWFTEAMDTQEEVMRRASEIVIPLLVLCADGDTIVDPAAEREWFEQVTSSDKTFEAFEDFRHELFNEVDRARPFQSTVSWIESRL